MCVAQAIFYWQSKKVHEHSSVECRECSNSYCCVAAAAIIIIIIISDCYILLQVM